MVEPRPVTQDELLALQSDVAEYAPRPIELSVWYKAETVISANGLSSYKNYTRQTLQERIETLPEVFGLWRVRIKTRENKVRERQYKLDGT